jgi:WD40 repeat protein
MDTTALRLSRVVSLRLTARVASVTILIVAVYSAAAPPTNQPAEVTARFDRLGDPLPAGAALRLGTIRLRQNQHVEGVAFSPDGKTLVSTGWDDTIRFWDPATGPARSPAEDR